MTPMAALAIRIRNGTATAAETKEWRRLAAIDFAVRMLKSDRPVEEGRALMVAVASSFGVSR